MTYAHFGTKSTVARHLQGLLQLESILSVGFLADLDVFARHAFRYNYPHPWHIVFLIIPLLELQIACHECTFGSVNDTLNDQIKARDSI
jgi:hypothetical protein